jgi:hypothetical protein
MTIATSGFALRCAAAVLLLCPFALASYRMRSPGDPKVRSQLVGVVNQANLKLGTQQPKPKGQQDIIHR